MAGRRPESDRGSAKRADVKAPHDVGGDPGGHYDPADHEKAFWEHRADAIRNLTRHIARTDEMRRIQEGLGRELYDSLGYTERQITSFVQVLLEKGVVTTAELAHKVAEIEAREKAE
jgi:hypothetical protein